jgi:hypothetical protein
MTNPQKMYRYESRRYSVTIDAEAEIFGVSYPKLQLIEYNIHSETPCGYWYGYFGEKDHWCSKTSRKRHAHTTKEAALTAYIERKKAFLRHSENRVKRASQDLAIGYLEAKNA